MNLKDAAAIAKQHVGDRYAINAPHNIRLENFLYDDHLMVWTLTIGFAPDYGRAARVAKLVRVSEANNTVLSVADV
jgi:hypothetical protein